MWSEPASTSAQLRPLLLLSSLLLFYDHVRSGLSLSHILYTMLLTTTLLLLWQILKQKLKFFRSSQIRVSSVEWPQDKHVSMSRVVRVHFTTARSTLFRRSVNLAALRQRLSAEVRVLPTTVINNDSCYNGGYSDHMRVSVSIVAFADHLELIFPSRQAGHYTLLLRLDEEVVQGFPSHANLVALGADADQSCLQHNRTSTLLMTENVNESLQICLKDRFGNVCSNVDHLADRVSILVQKLAKNNEYNECMDSVQWLVYAHSSHLLATLIVLNEGWYKASILLDHKPIDVGTRDRCLSLIVLRAEERIEVTKHLASSDSSLFLPFSVSFEAQLIENEDDLEDNNKKSAKKNASNRSVACTMSSKQLIVKDYLLKIIPRRLFTFRLAPVTRLVLKGFTKKQHLPMLSIEDGCQKPVLVVVKKAFVMAGVYQMLLLRRVGGSESFEGKQTYFRRRLLQHHLGKGHQHLRMGLRVDRNNLLGSSLDRLRWFSEADWCRLFEIDFIGEPGLDTGGPRREWFELLCRSLFDPSQGYFVSVEEESEAVHPNPNPPSFIKPKVYKLAGKLVGKCLYESAQGTTYRLQLPIRLAKSLLAQMVGMRVQYSHFAEDAPNLYASKIAFIESHSVKDLDLSFSHDHFDSRGNIVSTVNLKPNGASLKVDDGNKLEYLDLLAQHLLCQRMLPQTQLFISGLNSMVPDSLLSLFDENELELLLCGLREYSVDDLQNNHVVVDEQNDNHQVQWFFMALRSLSREQFAKLMQFVTGSSHLPIGGFAELKPNFQIVCKGGESKGQLPTAHTCFNMLNLPCHDNYQSFEKALITAITEGSEGFSMA